MTETKVCTGCKCEHPIDYFSLAWVKKRPGIRRPKCKACASEGSKKYYLKNRKEQDRKHKERLDKSPEKRHKNVLRKRQWRKDNPEMYAKEKAKDKIRQRAYVNKLKTNKDRITDWLVLHYGDEKCLDCGGSFPWCAMDFDHREGEQKNFTVATYGTRRASEKNIKLVTEEIQKCDLICSNCHRIRTHILRQHKTHNSPNARTKDEEV